MHTMSTIQGSRRRLAIVRYIITHQAANGYAPTVRELAAAVGLSEGTVLHYLNALRCAGIITWESGTARTLRVLLPRFAESDGAIPARRGEWHGDEARFPVRAR